MRCDWLGSEPDLSVTGAVCCELGLVGHSVPKSPGPLFGPSPPLLTEFGYAVTKMVWLF